MMLFTRGQPHGFRERILGRLAVEPVLESARKRDYILYSDNVAIQDLRGYAAILTHRQLDKAELSRIEELGVGVLHSVPLVDNFKPGQVVLLDGQTGFIRILYRPNSAFNSIFATDRCNSRCLMCSQPPRDIDDSDRIREHLRLVELMDPSVEYLGITGGEPTLLKDDLFALIAKCKQCLPKARLHVLTNGRMFYYESFARRAADVGHPHLTWAIPLYSDIDREHDYIVQGRDAFLQSTTGIYNLARCGQQIEIRIVLHALSYKRLPRLAEFIYRNFPFVSHIALMGLEIVGYAKANLDLLWVDPFDYRDELRAAVSILANRGMHVSIYNHQLCVLDESLWVFARKSISDWKNVYLKECGGCDLRDECGGFFTSAMIKHSSHIRSIASPHRRDDFPSRVLSRD